jgi:outer membrane immunogenic protein
MRRIAIAASLVMLAGTALAADFRAPFGPRPMVAPPGWTGFYAGLNAGGAFANSEIDFSLAGVPFASIDNSLRGAIGGVQAGYNWQSGAFVFGAEADAQLSGVQGRLTAPCAPGFCGPPPLAASYGQDVAWFATARGRVGYASPTWLIYATAGFAYGRLETDASASAGGLAASFESSEDRTGWTAGGGIEVALAPNWSAKLEYLYLDFGDRSLSWNLAPLPPITDTAHLTMNVVRAGVNYRF